MAAWPELLGVINVKEIATIPRYVLAMQLAINEAFVNEQRITFAFPQDFRSGIFYV